MVREVLAGEGDNFAVGVANYVVRQLQRNGPPQDTFDNLAAHSAEKFLGIPMLCISCHDGVGHLELVNWYLRGKTREDFWKMAAFFSRTTSRGARYADPANPNANIIRFNVATNPNGAYRLNTTDGNKSPRQPAAGQPDTVSPAFLLTGEQPKPGEPYRTAYGRMLTADRQFARATVNLLWKEMFGRGFVEPVNAFDLAKLDRAAVASGAARGAGRRIHRQGLQPPRDPAHDRALEHLSALVRLRRHASRRDVLRAAPAAADAGRGAARRGGHGDGRPGAIHRQGMGTVNEAMQLPDPIEARRAPASCSQQLRPRQSRRHRAHQRQRDLQALALMNDPS